MCGPPGVWIKCCVRECLWGCVQMRLPRASVDAGSRLPSPVWTGILQATEGLNGTKGEGRCDSPPFFPASLCELGHLISPSPALGLEPMSLAPWFSGLRTQTELHHRLSWVSSWQMADHGSSGDPSQFLIINLPLAFSLSLSLVLLLWRTLLQMLIAFPPCHCINCPLSLEHHYSLG